jgi:hypothetical protein
LELLKEGTYRAKISDYGVGLSKKGDPRPIIAFEIETGEAKRQVFWSGSFNGGGLDITMEALVTCGLKNPHNFMFLADGKRSGILNTEAYYDVKVSENPAEDGNKAYNRVEWIRAEGASKFRNAITVQDFAVLIQQQELHGKFIDYLNRKNIQPENSPVRKTAEDNIPF